MLSILIFNDPLLFSYEVKFLYSLSKDFSIDLSWKIVPIVGHLVLHLFIKLLVIELSLILLFLTVITHPRETVVSQKLSHFFDHFFQFILFFSYFSYFFYILTLGVSALHYEIFAFYLFYFLWFLFDLNPQLRVWLLQLLHPFQHWVEKFAVMTTRGSSTIFRLWEMLGGCIAYHGLTNDGISDSRHFRGFRNIHDRFIGLKLFFWGGGFWLVWKQIWSKIAWRIKGKRVPVAFF